MHVLIVSVNGEERVKLKYLICQWICLFMFVSFLYHEANMSYVCVQILEAEQIHRKGRVLSLVLVTVTYADTQLTAE